MRAELPGNEEGRLRALDDYAVLDTAPESQFDDLTQLAAQICATPTAVLTLVGQKRQWFKSRRGLDVSETHRDLAFCAHTILEPDLMEVPDAARDVRFADNALVTGPPHIRFYAGVPLRNQDGFALGALAVIDYEPRRLKEDQRNALRILGRQALAQMELRRSMARQAGLRLQAVLDSMFIFVGLFDLDGRIVEMNRAPLDAARLRREDVIGKVFAETFWWEHSAAAQAQVRAVLARAAAGETVREDFSVQVAEGAITIDGTFAPLCDADGRVVQIVGSGMDVTARKRQEEHISRLNRTRGMMSRINALIVRTRSRAELFQEACRIAVEQGGFGLAWIGVVLAGEIVPVAIQGEDGRHLAQARFPLTGEAPGRCVPTVLAVREARPRICNDTGQDPVIGPWREPLLRLGYASFIAYPLIAGGQVLGCLNLYAARAGFFDDDEVKLLGELANDIAFALAFIIKDETLDLMAIYDPLTRLPNRSLFVRRLDGFIHAAQDSGRRFALMMLDVERFQAINNAIGHDGGDELLRVVGERLKFHAGGPSFMARITGDRFAVVIPDLDRDADVEALVRRGAWDRLDPPFRHGDQEFAVSLKIGIAVFPPDGADGEDLLRNAELALEHGRVAGQRQTRYMAEMGDVATRKMRLWRQLQSALSRGEFRLHYQPRVDLRTGRVCGGEALLRWQSPGQGLVMPAGIIPLMEETGLIVDVGRWALEQAIRDREGWRRDGLAAPRIGVNVAAVQLREKGFADMVRTLLARASASADGLELEVTESMTMTDADANIATLRTLRDLGVTVSMDDFGTGYSSLNYLTRLPLNALKIDRAFIETLTSSPDTTNIVSAIIALAHSLKLRVVAEGVETEEQLRLLRRHGCDEIQGFLFSQAVPAEEFVALLRSGRTLAG